MSGKFDPAERHNDAMVEAIHKAARLIATAITEGFHHMADTEAQALADLNAAVSALSDAVTAEIAALVAALAANVPPVDHSPAIEASVAKLNDLATALKASVPPAPTPAP
jgi:hypothetical protein